MFVTENNQLKFADVTFRDTEMTVINRRMYREAKAKKNHSLRQKKYLEKKNDGDNDKEMTPPSSTSSSSSSSNDDIYMRKFDEFWKLYPKKRDKKKALKAFIKLKPDNGLHEKILNSVVAWKNTDDWKKNDGEFIPLPTSFLNGERWNDELPKSRGLNFSRHFSKASVDG